MMISPLVSALLLIPLTHIIANVEKWKLTLKNDIQGLRSKMTADFKDNLASMVPTELFEMYGTHFLREVIVGGRANYIATTRTSAFESNTKLRVAAEASFKSVSSREFCLGRGGRQKVSKQQLL